MSTHPQSPIGELLPKDWTADGATAAPDETDKGCANLKVTPLPRRQDEPSPQLGGCSLDPLSAGYRYALGPHG